MKKFLDKIGKYKPLLKQYSALIYIPLLLGVILLICVSSVIRNQIDERGRDTALNFQARASSAMQEINYLSDTLCRDEAFLNLLQQSKSDSYGEKTASAVTSTINNHIMRSRYVSQVKVFCPDQNAVYSHVCRYSYTSARSLLSFIAPVVSLDSLESSEGWYILGSNYSAPYYIRNIYSDDNELLGIMVISMDMSSFLNILIDMDADLAALFNDDFYLASSIKAFDCVDWYDSEHLSQILGRNVRCFYVEDADYTYMVAISTGHYYRPLYTILTIFGVYFIFAMILGFIAAYRASANRYSGMIDLINGLPQDPGEDSSYDEVMSAIRKGLQENPYEFDRRARALRYILRGYYNNGISEQDLNTAGIVPSASYRVVLFNMNSFSDVFSFDRDDRTGDAHRLIISTAVSSFSGNECSAVVTNIDLVFCAVYCFPSGSPDIDSFKTAVENTLSMLELSFGFNITVTVSSPVSSADELHTAYEEAASLYNYIHATNQDVSVMFCDGAALNEPNSCSRNFNQDLLMLVNTLQSKNYALVPNLVKDIMAQHLNQSKDNYMSVNPRLQAITTVLCESIRECDTGSSAKQNCDALRLCDTTGALSSLCAEIFTNLAEQSALPAKSDSADLGIVEQACQYIESHLDNYDLSVAQICEKIGVSYPYLSQIFRKKINCTVVEYINNRRIEKAKTLLVDSNLTMSAVAEKIGYNNTVTFNRNFKHYVGITPAVYRELNHK